MELTDSDRRKKNKVLIGEVRPRFSNGKQVLILHIHHSALDMPQPSAIPPSEYPCLASSALQACARGWGCQTARAEL